MIDKDKHKKWGFIVYRSHHSDDGAWNKFLVNIRHETEKELNLLKAGDLLTTGKLTVMEDKGTLDDRAVEQV